MHWELIVILAVVAALAIWAAKWQRRRDVVMTGRERDERDAFMQTW